MMNTMKNNATRNLGCWWFTRTWRIERAFHAVRSPRTKNRRGD